MRLAHIDWNSDGVWVMIALFIFLIVVGVLLERASPRSAKTRKRRTPHRPGEARRDDLIV